MRASEAITAPISAQTFSWPLSWVAHYFVAVAGAMIIGFLPEAVLSERVYYNTGLEPYSPMIAITAFLLGYFVSVHIFKGRAATFVWIIGLAWMMFGIYDTTRYWSASWSPEKTRWGYMLANLFGPTRKCSGSECLGELFFTTPFTASIVYSIGAYLAKQRDARRET
jgi:CDP-diglyceride synthetase